MKTERTYIVPPIPARQKTETTTKCDDCGFVLSIDNPEHGNSIEYNSGLRFTCKFCKKDLCSRCAYGRGGDEDVFSYYVCRDCSSNHPIPLTSEQEKDIKIAELTKEIEKLKNIRITISTPNEICDGDVTLTIGEAIEQYGEESLKWTLDWAEELRKRNL